MKIYRLHYIRSYEHAENREMIEVWHISQRAWSNLDEAVEAASHVSKRRKCIVIEYPV